MVKIISIRFWCEEEYSVWGTLACLHSRCGTTGNEVKSQARAHIKAELTSQARIGSPVRGDSENGLTSTDGCTTIAQATWGNFINAARVIVNHKNAKFIDSRGFTAS